MCGIAGWFRRGGRAVSRAALAAQTQRLVHRGPDEEGCLVDRDFGFAMRRLSIIDIAGGQQPIASADGRFAIVCNGEIVNHRELRRELAGKYPFRTNSDVETMLAAYAQWGDEAWGRLEGMFAAAIWDRLARSLTLVRDALGIKPLFVTEQRGGLAFASEISALRVLPGHDFDLDDRGIEDFFRFGHVLGPRTIWRQVRQLPPGHLLRIGPVGTSVTRAYWQPRIAVESGLSEQEWVEEARRRLLCTVEQHMLSDVPVGAFLSGGVDSGAISAAMARAASSPFKVFTAGFPGSKIDESVAARSVADHLGCEHVVLPIEPQVAADVLPAVQRSFDEPTAANSAIPLWYLSREASRHVKVVLCGEGGDELFLGYNRQRWAERMRRWSPAVRALGGVEFLSRIPDLKNRKLNYLRDHAERFRDGALLADGYERFFAAVTIMPANVRSRLLSPDLAPTSTESLVAEHFPEPRPDLSELEQFMLGDLAVHMPASLLQRLDRSSMAHSLEARVPFLSRGFVEWALTVPPELKLRRGTGKYLLRKAVAPWLPQGALKRGKLGFQMPLADWFVGGFNDFARDAWQSSRAASAGYLDPRAVDQLFDDHRAGRANHGRILYAIAMFSCWWSEQRHMPARVEPPIRVTAAL